MEMPIPVHHTCAVQLVPQHETGANGAIAATLHLMLQNRDGDPLVLDIYHLPKSNRCPPPPEVCHGGQNVKGLDNICFGDGM